MPSFNILHYMLAGAIILALGSLTYAKVQTTRLAASEGRYNRFVAETEAQASAQILKNWKETARRDGITQKLERDNAKLQTNLAARYAEYRRLLNSKAGSSGVSALPAAAEGIAKPEHETRLVRALEQLESRVLSELAESRDSAIMQSNMCADWLSEQKLVP